MKSFGSDLHINFNDNTEYKRYRNAKFNVISNVLRVIERGVGEECKTTVIYLLIDEKRQHFQNYLCTEFDTHGF